ncbi:hypothetical protein PCO82_07595 [Pectobacteriaceae bacterium CE90]|nr:hypothetical protein PCO82_07595 [Pectobacteriaceae bacterium CE90]
MSQPGFYFFTLPSMFTDCIGSPFLDISYSCGAPLLLDFERGVRVIDVALEAGFKTQGSFMRLFRRTFGQPLSTFQRPPDGDT